MSDHWLHNKNEFQIWVLGSPSVIEEGSELLGYKKKECLMFITC